MNLLEGGLQQGLSSTFFFTKCHRIWIPSVFEKKNSTKWGFTSFTFSYFVVRWATSAWWTACCAWRGPCRAHFQILDIWIIGSWYVKSMVICLVSPRSKRTSRPDFRCILFGDTATESKLVACPGKGWNPSREMDAGFWIFIRISMDFVRWFFSLTSMPATSLLDVALHWLPFSVQPLNSASFCGSILAKWVTSIYLQIPSSKWRYFIPTTEVLMFDHISNCSDIFAEILNTRPSVYFLQQILLQSLDQGNCAFLPRTPATVWSCVKTMVEIFHVLPKWIIATITETSYLDRSYFVPANGTGPKIHKHVGRSKKWSILSHKNLSRRIQTDISGGLLLQILSFLHLGPFWRWPWDGHDFPILVTGQIGTLM